MGDEAVLRRLEAWRKQDRRLYERVAHTNDKLAGRRREAYRVLAAQLCHAYGAIVVEDMAIPQVTRPGPAEAPTDQQADLARRQARVAAPGLFRSVLATTAKREGVRFISAPAAGTTRMHNACGTHLDQSGARSITMWCPVCEVPFDQDENAAKNLLATLAVTQAES
ncbi:MAG: zinc ribbon domain-containing protein [Actinobacteria bacterium]|nr:zinc ribbon domain-containing protein [Actinomycetota bacterium]